MIKSITPVMQTRLRENDGKVFTSEELKKLLFLEPLTHLSGSRFSKAGLIVSVGHNQWQVKFAPPHKVSLALDKHWRPQMLAGEKLCTTRSYIRGRLGDQFNAFGQTWEIIAVCRFPLGVVSELFYKLEGCRSPWEFRRLWNKFHPEKPYNRYQKVYVHLFMLGKEGS